MGLAEIADRLYGVHPGEFTHSRDDEVREAKAAGDPALAARVKTLRRPSTSAWLVNTLVRQAPDQLDELLQLGEELRAAQLNFAGPQLRRLVERRRSAISELTVTAVRLSVAAGHQVGDPAIREVAATLDAAVVDEAAADAVRSGRLLRRLDAAGFDAVDVEGAVAVPDADGGVGSDGRARPALRAVRTPPRERPARPSPQQQAADAARERAAVAERALVRAEAALGSADEAFERACRRVEHVEQELADARKTMADSRRAAASARQDRDAAMRARDSAQAVLIRADAALGS
jgi:hypothetical protein